MGISPLVRLMPLNATRYNFRLQTQPKLLLRVTVCVCCCCGVQCELISPVNPIWPINSPVSLFAPCPELLAALTCLTKLLTRAVIMASHFLARDCFFFRGCCMEAPLSSVQEHLSAPLCITRTQVYVEEHFCSLLLGLKQKKPKILMTCLPGSSHEDSFSLASACNP